MANTNNPNQKNQGNQGNEKRRNLNEDREPMSNPTGAREKQGGSVERDIERDRDRQGGRQGGQGTPSDDQQR
jgi:hypothetical protein